jgi:hypothetical protein
MVVNNLYKVAFSVLTFILMSSLLNAQSVRPFVLNIGGNTYNNNQTQLDWNLGESISIKYYTSPNAILQLGLLQPEYIVNASNVVDNNKYDIGFVLQGYDSNRMFYDTTSFAPIAHNIVRMLHELSFGRVNTYKIYMGGIDSRNPISITSDLNIMTLQASLDGWPETRWDYLRGMTGFWYTVPVMYRPIITNAITWLKTNKKTFFDWYTITPEGKIYGDSILNNVVRMGPDAAELYLKSTWLPENYDPLNHKVTYLAFNSNKGDNFAGAASQMLYYMGIKMNNGDTIPPYNGTTGNFNKVEGLYLSLDSSKLANSTYYYTAVHELVHSFGVSTHDKDPNYINKGYGVLNSNGALESIHALPAWDRYFWAGWLSKNTITTNIAEISDLKGKFELSDTSSKYILQIVGGDTRGCGGTYKELYDGKWYTYTVDNYGTLTYIEPIDNTNYGFPIIEVQPFDRNTKPGDKIFFNVQATGLQNKYVWKKNGTIVSNAIANYLSINSVTAKDTGTYQVIITNSKGTVYSDIVKLTMNCPLITAPIITASKSTTLCLGDSLQLSSNNLGLNNWYKDGVSISLTTSTLNIKQAGNYTNAIIQDNGCIALSNNITVNYTSPIVPIITRDSLNNLVSSTAKNSWYKDGVLLSDSINRIKPSVNGYYTAKSILNGCISSLSNTYYYLVTDVINLNASEYIRLAPNPFEDLIYLDFSLKGYYQMNVEVVNMATGTLVAVKTNISSKMPIQLTTLTSGVYAFKVMSKDGKLVYTFKIVKI